MNWPNVNLCTANMQGGFWGTHSQAQQGLQQRLRGLLPRKMMSWRAFHDLLVTGFLQATTSFFRIISNIIDEIPLRTIGVYKAAGFLNDSWLHRLKGRLNCCSPIARHFYRQSVRWPADFLLSYKMAYSLRFFLHTISYILTLKIL